MARLVESMFLQGPAGRLEALHEIPGDGVALERAAVLCHPHPLHGGTMHNKVVFRMARAARRAGAAVLRFQFRGVGQSDGSYDEGLGEQDDLRAALACMSQRYPGLPLMTGGFSFGARVALAVCGGEARVERIIAAGTPVAHGEWTRLAQCGCAKFFLHSTRDEHGQRPRMEAVYAAAARPKSLIWIESSDHFFGGALDELEQAAFEAMRAAIPAP